MQDRSNNIRAYLQPAFLICTAVLATAGAGMSITINKIGVYLKKEPIPLKKSLDLLDENGLDPYQVEASKKLKIDNEEVLKALGTKYYIQWIISDANADVASPTKNCLLFITYYDCPDKIPHVPEECYTGSGFQILKPDAGRRFGCHMGRSVPDGVTFQIMKNGFKEEINGKYIVFGSKDISDFGHRVDRFPVIYFFRVNGEYAGGREDARIALNKNLFGKSSYFSKVELAFNQTSTPPDRKEAIAATEKILSVILPVLEKEHWPDLDK
jgi:hypothetical protein